MKVTSLPEQLLFSTVRVEAEGHSNERVTGTGFFFTHKIRDQRHLFIVTNKHVIQNTKIGWMLLTESSDNQPRIGVSHRFKFEDFENLWFGHEDKDVDVAILPFGALNETLKNKGTSLFFRAIDSSNIPTEEQLKMLSVLEDIIFVGYPNGIWDTKNLLPIYRQGITATPITIDFEGEKKFLIDASVFPGSSGSPVFIYDRPSRAPQIVIQHATFNFLFLGILSSVYYRSEHNEIQMVPFHIVDVPMALSKQMIDLGVVFNASTILETIEQYLAKNATREEV